MAAANGGVPLDTVLDLGVMAAPILVFGGAYSNLQALQAMLRVAREDLGIPADRIIHTGDVVAYCAQPRETSELLRASGVHCLMGNCEESIATGSLDCGCGFPEDSACNAYSANWYRYASRALADHPELRQWMRQMPRQIRFTVAGRRLAVVHGSPHHISEFVWPSAAEEALLGQLALLPPDVDGVVCGHSGLPFARLLPPHPGRGAAGPRLWLNAGVIGMPANDGTARSWFAVLAPSPQGLEVQLRALHYAATEAAEAIRQQPALVRGYADALVTGVWPSHDVMPLEEQMSTGVPLRETTLLWPAKSSAAATAAAALVPLQTRRPARILAWGAVFVGIAAFLLSAWSRSGPFQRRRSAD